MAATTATCVPPSRFTIEIDASNAFGTAHHASTRGCLLALDELAKRGRPDLVLDLGTGSGVLAIAAARAFDRPVVATDNDPVAVAIAADNARKAGVAHQVHAIVAEGFAHPALRRIRPDLILANILARPLSALAPAMAKSLAARRLRRPVRADGAQARAIEARYCSHGFVLEKQIILDGWATLVLGRRSATHFARLIGADASAYNSHHVSEFRRGQRPGGQRRPGQGSFAGTEDAAAQRLPRSP